MKSDRSMLHSSSRCSVEFINHFWLRKEKQMSFSVVHAVILVIFLFLILLLNNARSDCIVFLSAAMVDDNGFEPFARDRPRGGRVHVQQSWRQKLYEHGARLHKPCLTFSVSCRVRFNLWHGLQYRNVLCRCEPQPLLVIFNPAPASPLPAARASVSLIHEFDYSGSPCIMVIGEKIWLSLITTFEVWYWAKRCCGIFAVQAYSPACTDLWTKWGERGKTPSCVASILLSSNIPL